MATDTRSRGISASAGPRRASARPLYEDFTPQIESKDDRQANTVYIRLPGFSKDELRIVADTSRGVLRVRGERPLAGNRWSRFLQEVPVPDSCDMTETRARFEGGALRITMPKKIPAAAAPAPRQSQSPPSPPSSDEPASPQPSPPPAPSRPAAFPPPQPLAPRPAAVPPPMPDAPRPAAFPPPEPAMPRPTPPQPEPAAPRPVLSQPQPTTPRLAPPPTHPPAPRLTPSIQRRPRDDPKPLSPPPSLPAVARPSLFDPPPLPEVARITPRIQPRPRDEIEPKPEPVLVAPPAINPAPTTLHTVPHPAPEPPRVGPIAAEMIRRPTEEKQRPAPFHLAGGGGSEAKERAEGEEKRKGTKGWFSGEERKMVVNMGAAVLVIAGLGAWISYTLSSSAKSNN